MNTAVIPSELHALAAALVLWRSVHFMSRNREDRRVILWVFAVTCLLMSDLYWIIYDLLQPQARMPFAANEICEGASFLLLAGCLTTVFFGRFGSIRRVELGTAAFAAANVLLWIFWSGEWLQDVLIGLAFGYLLCRTAACMKLCGALRRGEWIALASLSGLLVLLEAASLLAPERAGALLDAGSTALLFAVLAFFTVGSIRALRAAGGEDRAVSLSFAVFVWSLITLYSTEGTRYLAALPCSAAALALMLLALEREVEKL